MVGEGRRTPLRPAPRATGSRRHERRRRGKNDKVGESDHDGTPVPEPHKQYASGVEPSMCVLPRIGASQKMKYCIFQSQLRSVDQLGQVPRLLN